MLSRADQPSDLALARYLENDLSEVERVGVEAALAHSLAARRRSEQLQGIRAALAAHPPALDGIDITASVLAEVRRPQGRGHLVAWLLVAAVACLGVASALPRRAADSDAARWAGADFVVKSASGDSAQAKVHATFQVYRVAAGASPRAVSSRFDKSDGLLFGYTNLGVGAYEHLMLFGVDASGRVLWFYPAYERAGIDPSSIEIARNVAERALPDVVHHDYAPGALTIYALFTRVPLHVSQVEAWISRQMPATQRPAEDSLLYTRGFEVNP
jgi:hypothetical protein